MLSKKSTCQWCTASVLEHVRATTPSLLKVQLMHARFTPSLITLSTAETKVYDGGHKKKNVIEKEEKKQLQCFPTRAEGRALASAGDPTHTHLISAPRVAISAALQQSDHQKQFPELAYN